MKNSISEEILDLVDINDRVIGQMARSDVYAQKKSNFRVINALLVNSKGQLWIPRRTAHKRIFPLYLDASVAGHVSSGETYEQAFERELKEELNLDLSKINYSLVAHMTPHEHGVAAFAHVYKIMMDDVPNYNRDDFFEYYWLTADELFARVAAGDQAKSDTIKIVQQFSDSF